MKKYLVKVFLEHFAFGLTISVSVVWMLAQGLNLPTIALTESLALTFGLLIDIPTGFISDKFGRKITLIAATILQAGAFMLFAYSHDFWQFLLAAIVLAAGFAFASGTEEAYIYEKQPKTYRKTLSNVNIVDEAATILGLLAAPFLITLLSLQAVFVAASILMIITAFVSWVILQNTTKHHIPSVEQVTKKQKIISLFRKHLVLILLFIALAIYYEGGRIFWQPQLLNSGFKTEQLGFLFAAFKGASLAGAYAGRHQRASPKKEILIIGVLIACSFVLIASSVPYLVIAGFLLYSFLENIYRIIESNFLQNIADTHHRASFLSAANLVRQGYSIVAIPLLSIAIISNTAYAFYLLAGLQISGALLFWIFIHHFQVKA